MFLDKAFFSLVLSEKTESRLHSNSSSSFVQCVAFIVFHTTFAFTTHTTHRPRAAVTSRRAGTHSQQLVGSGGRRGHPTWDLDTPHVRGT